LEWTRVKVRGERTGLPNILHILSSERPGQYRGVPYLAPVIETLLQQRRYTESELMSAVVQSFFTAWIKTETDASVIPIAEVGDGEGGEGAGGLSSDENEYEMGPGTVTHLKPGENITFGAPNIPTAGFEMFTKTLAKLVGAALELPYDVLIKEFNSSYSASRAALAEAWEAFKMRRRWFVSKFLRPIYELWLAEAVARGRIKAPGFFVDPLVRKAWCGATWVGPVQVALDPNKEATAALLMASQGIKTHKQITSELGGGDWDQNVEQLKIANEKLNEAGASAATQAPARNDEEEDLDNAEN
jgi:lambda family phage portal protein